MKKLSFLFIILFLFINVNAKTKDDIIYEINNVNICDLKTKVLFNTYKITYTKLLNERNISSENINKIYSSIIEVKNILNNKNICSISDKDKLSINEINSLKNTIISNIDLLNESNVISDSNDNSDISISYDSNNNSINVYEGYYLKDIINIDNKLNYVGINKSIYIIIGILIITLSISLFIKNNIKYILRYTSIFLLIVVIIYNSYFSNVINFISSNTINNNVSDLKVSDNSIVSYPSYGSIIGKIFINNDSDNIYYGDTSDILKKGIGASSNSVMFGEEGSIILSGHNTGIFNNLDELNINSKVYVETIYGSFTYEVYDRKIIEDTNIDSVYNSDSNLIMYTCYPNNLNIYSSKRLVLYLNLIESKWFNE